MWMQPFLKDYTSLAVVARDDNGQIVKGWVKNFIWCEPLQAKASAILWAL
jgi:hypothetical protein